MKKAFVFGIILLFIFMSINPSSAFYNVKKSSMPVSNGNNRTIISVDNEGDGDYTTIKEALNNSNPGDTIEVYSGTYYERGIIFEKEGITFQGVSYELGSGNDTGKPFINGEGKGQVIDIKSQRITIDNFRIENEGAPYAYGIISILRGADNCLVSHNDISHSVMGCIGCNSDNNSFIKNNISHSPGRQGIYLHEPCNNCLVSGNIISDCDTGVCVWKSNNNTITSNKIMRCRYYGIDVAVASGYNEIIGNQLENNSIGIEICDFFNSVKRNNFINNEINAKFYGIGTTILQCLTNKWFGNYWDRPRLLPYPILGALYLFFPFYFLPMIRFDWRPALKPYDIGV